MTDFKPIPEFEEYYIINKLGRIKALDRKINSKGLIINLKRQDPQLKITGTQTYVLLEDKNFKSRRVNVTRVVRNLFGRQKPIVVKKAAQVKLVVEADRKPLNRSGATGYQVEQLDNGKVIKVFATMASAAKAVGGEVRHISDVCHGKKNFYVGFQWRFKTTTKK